MSKRLTTADDVRAKVGVDTLVEVPRGGKPRAEQRREAQFRRLANIVGLADLPRPATIVVTAPRRTEGVAQVARAIAEHRAIQSERSLIVRADLHGSERATNVDEAPGVADFLAPVTPPAIAGFIQDAVPGEIPEIPEMPSGTGNGDPYALFTRERFGNLLQQARSIADVVVVEAPPITEAAEAQVICAAADAVVLVVERRSTRVPETVEACRLLGQVESRLLGAVIIDPRCTRRSAPIPPSDELDESADSVELDESADSDALDTVDLVQVRESTPDQTARP